MLSYRPLVASVHAKIGMIVVSWSHIDRDNPRQMDFYSTYFCASGEQLILLAKRANRIWIYIYIYMYIYIPATLHRYKKQSRMLKDNHLQDYGKITSTW